jgi:hypothetical protein
MPAFAVVEALDVIEHIGPCFVSSTGKTVSFALLFGLNRISEMSNDLGGDAGPYRVGVARVLSFGLYAEPKVPKRWP